MQFLCHLFCNPSLWKYFAKDRSKGYQIDVVQINNYLLKIQTHAFACVCIWALI